MEKQKLKRKPKIPLRAPKELLCKREFSKITALSQDHILANLKRKSWGWKITGEIVGNQLVAHIPTRFGGTWFDGKFTQLTENTFELKGVSGIDPRVVPMIILSVILAVIVGLVSQPLNAMVLGMIIVASQIIGIPYIIWIEYLAQKKLISRIEQALG